MNRGMAVSTIAEGAVLRDVMNINKILVTTSCIIVVMLVMTGCKNGMRTEQEKPQEMARKQILSGTEKKQETSVIPDHYEKVSGSGKVSFKLTPKYPEVITQGTCEIPVVKGRIYPESDKVYQMYVQGKDVTEKHIIDADDKLPQSIVYILKDGSTVSVGRDLSYSSSQYIQYDSAGVFDDTSSPSDPNAELPFLSRKDAAAKLKETLMSLGLPEMEFQYSVIAWDDQSLKKSEDTRFEQGLVEAEKRKKDWKKEDDIYYIYAYQSEKGMDVYNEVMSIYQSFAEDGPSNAQVRAVLGRNGFLMISTSFIYDLEWNGATATLVPFDQVVSVVENKFEMMLDDLHYKCNQATFAMSVSYDQNQKLVATPIWYFKVMDDNQKQYNVWVDAATGKEITMG
ncbi:hypothetical protein [Porcincola intestinalis]|uniref:hypothetical protein n=3 Tax=Porcincola intestinalis TaxID=2606632 RepID=UPI002A918F5B|nr:hypothetical protein [Porcincola intestinalis]MDY5579691.1 hypothetical protein [Porcincola intestinalis]